VQFELYIYAVKMSCYFYPYFELWKTVIIVVNNLNILVQLRFFAHVQPMCAYLKKLHSFDLKSARGLI
jgi:hypothetical protein